MADATNKKKVSKVVLPKEMGMKVPNSSIYDYDYCLFSEHEDLKFPYSVKTYEAMSRDTTLASALNAVQTIALRVPRFVEPYNETDTHKKRADFVNQCLGITTDNNDMTQSFDDFLREALSMNKYGFSVHEKVFRVRQKKFGSKYDDGKVGIKRLPIRPQNTIESFEYDEDGREIIGVVQQQSEHRSNALKKLLEGRNKKFDGSVKIPIESLMLFKADSNNGKGEGVSPLSYVYDTWRDYQRYKDLEGIAASKNLNGLPVVWMPAEYMNADPSDPSYSVYKTLVEGVSKIAIGQQSMLALPSDREDMTGQGGKLFDFSLMSSSSSNITAITAIIERLKKEMLLCLFAGEIAEGVDSTKTSMLNMLVENRIKEIFTVLNDDLIPQLFRLNGWDETKTPKIKYGKLREIPFEAFAKAIQQTKATNAIPITPKNINYISEELGLPDRVPEDMNSEDLKKILGVEDPMQSRASDGYSSSTGGLNGTSDKPPTQDNAAANKDNS